MNTLKDILMNKKVVFYGDSITHNWEKYTHDYQLTHGENYEYGLGYGYVKMLNDVCNFKEVSNFAVSGGCYANCSKLNPSRETFRHFPYQINRSLDKLKEAEVILIMFGTNDYSEQVSFGNDKDIAKDENQGDMSFFEGMNYGFSKIKQYNKNAKVFVINCLKRTVGIEENRTYNYSLNEYNLAIKHMCNIYNFNYIDVYPLFNIPNNFVGGNDEVLSDDGLHPNEQGYKKITNYLLNYEIK